MVLVFIYNIDYMHIFTYIIKLVRRILDFKREYSDFKC